MVHVGIENTEWQLMALPGEMYVFIAGVVGEQCNQKSAPFDKPQGKK